MEHTVTGYTYHFKAKVGSSNRKIEAEFKTIYKMLVAIYTGDGEQPFNYSYGIKGTSISFNMDHKNNIKMTTDVMKTYVTTHKQMMDMFINHPNIKFMGIGINLLTKKDTVTDLNKRFNFDNMLDI